MSRNSGAAIKYGKIEIAADGVTLQELKDCLVEVIGAVGYPEHNKDLDIVIQDVESVLKNVKDKASVDAEERPWNPPEQ